MLNFVTILLSLKERYQELLKLRKVSYINKTYQSTIAVNKLLRSQKDEMLSSLFKIANCFSILLEACFEPISMTKKPKNLDEKTVPITNNFVEADVQQTLKSNE